MNLKEFQEETVELFKEKFGYAGSPGNFQGIKDQEILKFISERETALWNLAMERVKESLELGGEIIDFEGEIRPKGREKLLSLLNKEI